MATIKEIYDYINEIAPFNTQLSFDNAGFLIGDINREVSNLGFCLDVTNEIICKAIENKTELIITHHPVIFNKLANVKSDSLVYSLIKNNIAVISAHTNYDCADGGVNDCLFDTLELTDKHPLESAQFKDFPPLARIGNLATPMTTYELARHIKLKLNSPDVRYCANGNDIIEKVAICGGSGSDLIFDAINMGVNALITSEIKHHEWLIATEKGIALFDAGHFSTEYIAMAPLCKKIVDKFPVDCELFSQSAPYKTV